MVYLFLSFDIGAHTSTHTHTRVREYKHKGLLCILSFRKEQRNAQTANNTFTQSFINSTCRYYSHLTLQKYRFYSNKGPKAIEAPLGALKGLKSIKTNWEGENDLYAVLMVVSRRGEDSTMFT